MERAVGDETDAKAAQGGDPLHLHGSQGEVVQALLGCQTQKVPGGGGALGEGHVPAGEVPAADVADFALADQLLHRLPDVLPRRGPVDVVHLVRVDVIGLQPPHARLARAPDVVGRQSAVVRAESHRLVHPGRQDMSSRCPLRFSHRPTVCSTVPYPFFMSGNCGPPYKSAVSKQLMPASMAASMTAKLLGSSTVKLKFMVEAIDVSPK